MNRAILAALALAGAVFGIGWCSAPAHAAGPVPAVAPGHFIGSLSLGPEDKNKATVETTSDGRQVWFLHRPFGYRTLAGDTIIVPAGESTDLASVPQWARATAPPDGPWVRAAVIHDFLYRTSGTCVRWKGRPSGCSRAAPYTRAEADHVLDEAMAALNIGWTSRWTFWSAVRVGGAGGWGS
jgi:hypothetical protein